ncbi:beta-galactosidase [Rhypophila decipiens]
MFRITLLSALLSVLLPVTVTGLPSHADPALPREPTKRDRTPYQLKPPPLDTPWTSKVGTNPWPEHPRPRLFREDWLSLNGIWGFEAFNRQEDAPASPPQIFALPQEVLVPSCIESGISGIMRLDVMHMYFARSFEIPSSWKRKNRVMLIFEAVDYEATVYVNGQKVGFNRGGYFRFSFDITEFIKLGESNELQVFVFDPTDTTGYRIPKGKQTLRPSHIWYTPCSGIWQSVWLESVPEHHITDLDIVADMNGQVTYHVYTSANESTPVGISMFEAKSDSSPGQGNMVLTHNAVSNQKGTAKVASPKLWTPDSPNLYTIKIKMGEDEVTSYTGFRTISSGTVKGVKRPLLNGQFVFQFGTLDQGYWPDGIHTPPTLEAMVYDLQLLKKIGMNMVRKHIKIEPDLFYQACDKLGLLVIQDMPAMDPNVDLPPNAEQQTEFERQVDLMVSQFKGYTSIVTWVIYNEGWGQITSPDYPEFRIAERIRQLDPTRLVNAVTGWNDHGAGDFHVCLSQSPMFDVMPGRQLINLCHEKDNHHYADPQCGTPWSSLGSTPYDPNRIGFQGEYGGLGHVPAKENLWPIEQAVNEINQTYEINIDLPSYHYRSHILFTLLKDQVAMHSCSGAVYTQTTDVEGEVNGLMTYDRRVVRIDVDQWKDDIKALFEAAKGRTWFHFYLPGLLR